MRGTNGGSVGAGSTNLGLGLFVAHKVVTAHGGTISVDSSNASGTTFTAVMPKRWLSAGTHRTRAKSR